MPYPVRILVKHFANCDNVRIMRKKPTQKPIIEDAENAPLTPLLALLRQLGTAERREEFAQMAETSVNYLYQLGTCRRVSCRPALARRIAAASEVFAKRYRTSVITFETVLTMCAACEVGA